MRLLLRFVACNIPVAGAFERNLWAQPIGTAAAREAGAVTASERFVGLVPGVGSIVCGRGPPAHYQQISLVS